MRVRVASVRGPLCDIEVAFHNVPEGEKCFQVTWSLMLVRDVAKKLVYDFEVRSVGTPPPPPPPAGARRILACDGP